MRRIPFDRDWTVTTADGTSRGPLTLPDDAMLHELRDPAAPCRNGSGYYPGGLYRYTKTFHAPSAWHDQYLAFIFEGVYTRSQVYVNGQLAGGRPEGYTEFEVPFAGLVRLGEDNLLEVVADNSRQPNSRWYSGSGIYRPVHLVVGEALRIADEGIWVRTVAADAETTAQLDVVVEVVNATASSRPVTLAVILAGPDGSSVAQLDKDVVLAPGKEVVEFRLELTRPVLWSIGAPHLHTAKAVLSDAAKQLDDATTTFGVRTVTVDAQRGLRINGQEVKLRGGCVHHDNGVIGAHTLEAAEDRRIRILKEHGYNAIRSAHNPLARATLRACDRHGVLVMDELSDMWTIPKTPHDHASDFAQWWERDLESMIRKDRNHPCVVLYSIGNEIGETARPHGIDLNRRLADRTRELDPTRPVTNGINGFLNVVAPNGLGGMIARMEKRDEKSALSQERKPGLDKAPTGFIAVLNGLMDRMGSIMELITRLPLVDRRTRQAFADLDVAGYNYMHARYDGDSRRHPKRVIVGTETNPPSTVRIWRDIQNRPNVIGDFVWTSWDYLGEACMATIEYGSRSGFVKPWPSRAAGEPIIDITGFAQTQAHLNQIAWRQEKGPFLAVQPVSHSGESRSRNMWRATDSVRSWSWPGHEGRAATVELYADAAQVELLLNGVSLGRRAIMAEMEHRAEFTLLYQPGSLTGVAYDALGEEVGRDVLVTAEDVIELRAEPEVDHLRADGYDLLYLPITLTDGNGVVHTLRDRDVTIDVRGAASLLGFGSANPCTVEGFIAPVAMTYCGRVLAVLRAGHECGDAIAVVSAPGCKPVTVSVPVVSVT